jgi:Fe2+ transport system protein FeoA
VKLKIIIIQIMKTLADLKPSETGHIAMITGIDGLSQRLAEMGFTPGQAVQVIRFAPLGDPMQIRIRGFNVALRRKEACRVTLERTS